MEALPISNPTPINSVISGMLNYPNSALCRTPLEVALHYQKIDCVMDPIYHALNQLETGYIDVDERGKAVSDVFGEVHEIGPAMLGWTELANRAAPNVDTKPIARIAKRLIAGVMIEPSDIQKARLAVKQVASRLMSMTEGEIQSMCNTANIAIHMQNAGLAERTSA